MRKACKVEEILCNSWKGGQLKQQFAVPEHRSKNLLLDVPIVFILSGTAAITFNLCLTVRSWNYVRGISSPRARLLVSFHWASTTEGCQPTWLQLPGSDVSDRISQRVNDFVFKVLRTGARKNWSLENVMSRYNFKLLAGLNRFM